MPCSDHGKHDGTCPECEAVALTRNHYFTGKLMQVADFNTEQRYVVERLRRHLRWLHGWGVVCGLKVKQHPQAACQPRFVCIEPGTAIDCCGHEIVVAAADCVDLTLLPAVKALIDKDKNDPNASHTLQICIRYRECPTEEVPIFYDDCGCDGDRCAPNRVLESYEIDVIVDPASTVPSSPGSVGLTLAAPIGIGGASAVAFAPGPPALLYAVSRSNPELFQIKTQDNTFVKFGKESFNGYLETDESLAVSADGTRVYFAHLSNPTSSTPTRHSIDVFDMTGTASKPPVQTFDFSATDTGPVYLAVGPDQRLLTLVSDSGNLFTWPTSFDGSSTTTPTPDRTVKLGTNMRGLALSSDGKTAYSAAKSSLVSIDITPGAVNPAPVTIGGVPGSSVPYDLAVVPATGGDLLAVIDDAVAGQLILINPTAPGTLLGTVALAGLPRALAVSPDGKWAYVLVWDASKNASLQVIDLARLAQKKAVTAGAPFPVGPDAIRLVLSPTGRTLYVPIPSDPNNASSGGIAVIAISEADCEGALWASLEGCPSCDHPNCVVLATIANYHGGNAFQDPTDPPSDPNDDKSKGISQIDNHTGRRILPSTQALFELIECAMAGGSGSAGPQGLQGNPGPGVEQDLTRIKVTSWDHDKTLKGFSSITRNKANKSLAGSGIWIAFTDSVDISTLSPSKRADLIFEVLGRKSAPANAVTKHTWTPLSGTVFPVTVDASGNATEVDPTATPKPPTDTLAFFWAKPDFDKVLALAFTDFLVRLHGDFVLDTKTPPRAVDVQFVRAAFPTGQRPAGTTFGIEGGHFESWFSVVPKKE